MDGKLPERAMNVSGKTRQALQRYGLALALACLALFLRGVLPFQAGTAHIRYPDPEVHPGGRTQAASRNAAGP